MLANYDDNKAVMIQEPGPAFLIISPLNVTSFFFIFAFLILPFLVRVYRNRTEIRAPPPGFVQPQFII